MSTKEDIRKRVDAHVAIFKVGDQVNTILETEEVEGKIVSIDGYKAQMETPWGTFTINLTITHLVDEDEDWVTEALR